MNVAIIYAGYNQANYIPNSLKPWIYLRETGYQGHTFKIYCVSVAFKEYIGLAVTVDNSKELLTKYKDAGLIDGLITEPDYVTEASARNMALEMALKDGATEIMLVDSDEMYHVNDIQRIAKFVATNEFIPWFKGSLKNYVFDEHTYLTEPFNPPRWFRVKCGNLTLKKMNFDNDALFEMRGELVSHNHLPHMTFPKSIIWAKHLTWMNNEASKRKIFYQMAHFGGICSYRWDNELGLVFNEEYFKKFNLPIPTVARDTPGVVG